jgi:hypothetical protein
VGSSLWSSFLGPGIDLLCLLCLWVFASLVPSPRAACWSPPVFAVLVLGRRSLLVFRAGGVPSAVFATGRRCCCWLEVTFYCVLHIMPFLSGHLLSVVPAIFKMFSDSLYYIEIVLKSVLPYLQVRSDLPTKVFGGTGNMSGVSVQLEGYCSSVLS